MSDGHVRPEQHSGATGSVDELLDRTVPAAAPGNGAEVRRLTILFADLVDSTVLSTRIEPEQYRLLVGGYRDLVQRTVERYQGHIASTKGDGLLVVFGHRAGQHDDARRAVQASLEITREVSKLSEYARRRFGVSVAVRTGVHRGLVYSDIAGDDVYGLAANLATRVSGLAPPGAAVVSHAVEALVRDDFDLEDCGPAPIKDIEEPVTHYRVLGERAQQNQDRVSRHR